MPNRDELVTMIRTYPWRGRPCADRKLCLELADRLAGGTEDEGALEEAWAAFSRIRARHAKNGAARPAAGVGPAQGLLAIRAVTSSDLDILVGLVAGLERSCNGLHALLRRLVVLDPVTADVSKDAEVNSVAGPSGCSGTNADGEPVAMLHEPCCADDTSAVVDEVSKAIPDGDPTSCGEATVLPVRPVEGACAAPSDDAEQVVRAILTGFKTEDVNTMPLPRLRWYAEAVVAEIRMWESRLQSGSHVLRYEVDQVLRDLLAAIRSRRPGFVRGLRRGECLNWDQIAWVARRKVSEFDADAALGTVPARHERGPRRQESRALMGSAPVPTPTVKRVIAVVGGDFAPKAIGPLADSSSFELEWSPGSATGARSYQQVCQRIRSRSLVGVILVRKYVSHAASDDIYVAARAAGVPVAQVWTPGTRQFQEAMGTIERRLNLA